MLVSMTGFGQGEASSRSARASVEVRSVNHRYFDLSMKLPKVLSSREHEIKEIIREKMQRGRVSVTMSIDMALPEYAVNINVPLMEQYVSQLQRFAKKHGLENSLSIDTLASLPEVFHLQEKEKSVDDIWPLVQKGLRQALVACQKMRVEEGKALEADMRARITAINQIIKKIEKRAPQVVKQHKKVLKERLDRLMEGGQVDRDRWLSEVAILADRQDFTEEVIRLKSHMAQMKKCLSEGGAVSKKLTYLLQEVHRESTTIASKASDAEIIEYTVSLKEESERMREQVQNLE